MEFGQSFAPFQQNQNGMQGAAPVSPVQQAIRVLSLRQPRIGGGMGGAQPMNLKAPGVLGAGSAVAPQLLGSQGSAGLQSGGMNPEQLLSMLFGPNGPLRSFFGGQQQTMAPTGGGGPMPPPMPPSPGPPPPKITVTQPPDETQGGFGGPAQAPPWEPPMVDRSGVDRRY